MKLETVDLSQLGQAKRVVLDKDSTTVIGGAADTTAVKNRCKELRTQIDAATSDYDRERLRERLAKLAGGVAVISVGAPSESEMKSRKEAFEDAISTTKAAAAEGVVPGAGLALLRAIDAVVQEAGLCEGSEATLTRIPEPKTEAPPPAGSPYE